MQNAHELYTTTICYLPASERLRLATLILEGLAQAEDTKSLRRSALDLLEEMPGSRLFKTSAAADDYLRQERDSWER
jgi:hypothetical protein